MEEPRTHNTSIMRRLWNSVIKKWVADVPDDIACCEFNCRELHCEQGQWETCEHRLRYQAIIKQRRAKGAKGKSTE